MKQQVGHQNEPAVQPERRKDRAGAIAADATGAALQSVADGSPQVRQLRALQMLADRRPAAAPVQRRVSIGGKDWGHDELAALGQDSAASEQLAEWIDDDDVHVFRDWMHALNTAESMAMGEDHEASQIWDNHESKFQTANTENDKGNSTYRAYPGGLDRYAPVNSGDGRPPDQVDNKDPGRHVCFIDDAANQIVMAQGKDSCFRIDAVSGANVSISVLNDGTGDWDAFQASLVPKVGLAPLDFYYVSSAGQLVGIHIGHKVCKILT